ncbi:MAG: CmcI family methyltransferase [Planctomycetaceae bacterium]
MDGRPIIQLPEDMIRMQEVIWRIQPDVLVEMGVAHGGSLVFYASLFEAMHQGRVVGVDIEIRPHNRVAIEEHPLAHRGTLVKVTRRRMRLCSKSRSVCNRVTAYSWCWTPHHQHVRAELEAMPGVCNTWFVHRGHRRHHAGTP